MRERRIVLSLCDLTGYAVEPWAKVGYECWTVDIQHPSGVGKLVNGVRRVGLDITKFCPPLGVPIDFIFAFPPCTAMAVSGARWFQEKGLETLSEALYLVSVCNRICEASQCPYLIENPVSTLATYWRKPDFSFDPCDYAGYLDDPSEDAYTKKTYLWVGNAFRMPPTKRIEPVLGSKMHLLPPSENRANLRSATPKGFAKAIFDVNYPCDSNRQASLL